MDSSISGTSGNYSRTTAFNRSLSPAGRILFLVLAFSNILIVAVGLTVLGAWPVLPFAGAEMLALTVAFYLISLRDGDFERLTIVDQAISVEVRERGAASQVEMNRAWAQLVRRMDRRGRRCSLALRYHGVEVAIGRLMNDEQRLTWSRELEGRLRIVNQ